MPTKDLQRWNQDGSNMEKQLLKAGYQVDLQYASNDIATQVSQVENMINSGQTDFETVATANWASEASQARMDAIISANYANGTKLDAVLCSNDSTALGVVNSLEANYTGEWPIITGQDCDIANVKNMIAGKQAMILGNSIRTNITRANLSAIYPADRLSWRYRRAFNDEKAYFF